MKIFLLVLVGIFMINSTLTALEWQDLHDRARMVDPHLAAKLAIDQPQSLENLYTMALIYLRQWEEEKAGGLFRSMLELDPDSLEARWGKAEVLRRQHDLKSSREILEKIVEENPDFAPAYISLAYIEYIEMNFQKCVKLAYKVVKMGKGAVDLKNLTLAHCLVAAGKGKLAHYGGPLAKALNGKDIMPYLKKAQRLMPEAPAVLFGLGSYYLLAPKIFGQDLEKAEELLQKTNKIDPKFPDVYVRLAQLALVKDDESEYERLMKKALELDPGNELARDVQSRTCKYICITETKED